MATKPSQPVCCKITRKVINLPVEKSDKLPGEKSDKLPVDKIQKGDKLPVDKGEKSNKPPGTKGDKLPDEKLPCALAEKDKSAQKKVTASASKSTIPKSPSPNISLGDTSNSTPEILENKSSSSNSSSKSSSSSSSSGSSSDEEEFEELPSTSRPRSRSLSVTKEKQVYGKSGKSAQVHPPSKGVKASGEKGEEQIQPPTGFENVTPNPPKAKQSASFDFIPSVLVTVNPVGTKQTGTSAMPQTSRAPKTTIVLANDPSPTDPSLPKGKKGKLSKKRKNKTTSPIDEGEEIEPPEKPSKSKKTKKDKKKGKKNPKVKAMEMSL